MELRHLRYFIMLAEELHFRKASEKLFIAQPALSRQIRQLEEELKVELFSRNNTNVFLTEAGAHLQKHAKELFYRLEQTQKELLLIESGYMGTVKIGYVGSAMYTFLPSLIEIIRKKIPHLKTELHEMATTDQLSYVSSGQLDVGFIRDNLSYGSLANRLILEETFSLALPVSHPAEKENFRGLIQMKDENFIQLPRNTGEKHFNDLLMLFKHEGIVPKIVHYCGNGTTMLKLIEKGVGISVVPTSLNDGSNPRIKFIELDKLPYRTHLSAIWRPDNKAKALQSFLSLLEEELAGR
jgi:LysR family transcriptional regulator, benzoate and cis,cis-muconate-responsive activator of ben and cat genes